MESRVRRPGSYALSLVVALAFAFGFGLLSMWLFQSNDLNHPTADTIGAAKLFVLGAIVGFVVGGVLAGLVPSLWQRRALKTRSRG